MSGQVLYTWTAQRQAQPLEIRGGQGSRFQTEDGEWWWDLGSTTWNANLGHGHPGMRRALAEAAERGLVAAPQALFPDKRRAADLLAEIAPPGLNRSFLCLSGAEANENAVKMARLVTGRRTVIARTRSYHGATLAMLSLSGDPRREHFEPGLPGVGRMADPYCYRCAFGLTPQRCARECAQDLERAIWETPGQDVAAVIVEGVTGANGVFPAPPGYFAALRAVCDRYGVMLICDEVLSGFGRTGRWFAIDHEGIVPDFVTCAKGLTAGYAPGGAVLVHERWADYFEENTLWCGLTHYAHPLTCAAICAAIEAYRQEGLIERAAVLGDWLGERLRQLQPSRHYLAPPRGLGLLWALELIEPESGAPLSAPLCQELAAAFKRRRLYVQRREHMVYLAPPLVIQQHELETALHQFESALDEVFAYDR